MSADDAAVGISKRFWYSCCAVRVLGCSSSVWSSTMHSILSQPYQCSQSRSTEMPWQRLRGNKARNRCDVQKKIFSSGIKNWSFPFCFSVSLSYFRNSYLFSDWRVWVYIFGCLPLSLFPIPPDYSSLPFFSCAFAHIGRFWAIRN